MSRVSKDAASMQMEDKHSWDHTMPSEQKNESEQSASHAHWPADNDDRVEEDEQISEQISEQEQEHGQEQEHVQEHGQEHDQEHVREHGQGEGDYEIADLDATPRTPSLSGVNVQRRAHPSQTRSPITTHASQTQSRTANPSLFSLPTEISVARVWQFLSKQVTACMQVSPTFAHCAEPGTFAVLDDADDGTFIAR